MKRPADFRPLTSEEERAIASLKRLAKTWPRSLMLYSASGNLHVMRLNEDGTEPETEQGGADPDSSVAIINIPNDGGDW